VKRENRRMGGVWKAYGIRMAVLALLAGPAGAQDIPFSPEATESCLAAATAEGGGLAAREACIGKSADACIDTPDGYSTVGMSYCLDQERQYWAAHLDGAYGALLEMETGAEEALKELGSAAASPVAALKEMQRAWTGYRDAACAYEASTWGGGTGAGPAANQCMMLLTGRQALALEDRLRMRSGP